MSFQEIAFNIAGAPLMIFWALIVFLPKWKRTVWLFESKAPMLFLASIYSVVVLHGLATDPGAFAVLANPTLSGVQQLLSTPTGASAGWIHFLCFDLLVATYIWKMARKRGHSFLWVSAIQPFVLMLAPLGWLMFEIVSFIVTRRKAIPAATPST